MKKILLLIALVLSCLTSGWAEEAKEHPPTPPKGQMHMHSLLFDVSTPGQIMQTWEGVDTKGKITCAGVTTLKRTVV